MRLIIRVEWILVLIVSVMGDENSDMVGGWNCVKRLFSIVDNMGRGRLEGSMYVIFCGWELISMYLFLG